MFEEYSVFDFFDEHSQHLQLLNSRFQDLVDTATQLGFRDLADSLRSQISLEQLREVDQLRKQYLADLEPETTHHQGLALQNSGRHY